MPPEHALTIEPMDVTCDVWHSGGTSSTFSRTTNGDWTLQIRLKATDSSNPEQLTTVYKYVTVGAGSGGA